MLLKLIGLTTDQTLARISAAAPPPRIPSSTSSLLVGSIGFSLVSIAAFAVWAFAGRALTRAVGEPGFYAVCALVFIGLAGAVLGRLVIGPGALRRFYALFTLAFLAYAALWCAAWFLLAGQRQVLGGLSGARVAEWLGSLVGTAAMAAVLCSGFSAGKTWPRVALILFLGNAAGYFLGDWWWRYLRSPAGAELLGELLTRDQRGLVAMLGWGAAFGLGFGLGIGHALHRCQEELRTRLAARSGATPL